MEILPLKKRTRTTWGRVEAETSRLRRTSREIRRRARRSRVCEQIAQLVVPAEPS
jgi:hypothetical protein